MKIKAIFAIAALTVASAANAELITNGNFESGNLSTWTKSGNVNISGPAGAAFYYGAGSAAQDGKYLVEFNGGNGPKDGILSQTFATAAGGTYVLSFQYGATAGGTQSLLAQLFDGIVANNAIPAALAMLTATDSNPASALSNFRLAFTAASSMTTLRFSDLASNNTINLDGVLDNVSVVPEPASLALMGLGLLGFAASRRKSAK